MALPFVASLVPFILRHSGMRRKARRFAAPRNDTPLFLPHQFLRTLSKHISPRLLVERLLHELADRKSRLHLRPRAHLGIPALHVGIIVERKALRPVGHGPG